jgi:hypothetical protein
MGERQSKPLAERHDRGTAWQGNGMVCVNPPLVGLVTLKHKKARVDNDFKGYVSSPTDSPKPKFVPKSPQSSMTALTVLHVYMTS